MIDSSTSKNTLINANTTIYATSAEQLTRLNQLLAKYLERKPFHNYTESIPAGDEKSYR